MKESTTFSKGQSAMASNEQNLTFNPVDGKDDVIEVRKVVDGKEIPLVLLETFSEEQFQLFEKLEQEVSASRQYAQSSMHRIPA